MFTFNLIPCFDKMFRIYKISAFQKKITSACCTILTSVILFEKENPQFLDQAEFLKAGFLLQRKIT